MINLLRCFLRRLRHSCRPDLHPGSVCLRHRLRRRVEHPHSLGNAAALLGAGAPDDVRDGRRPGKRPGASKAGLAGLSCRKDQGPAAGGPRRQRPPSQEGRVRPDRAGVAAKGRRCRLHREGQGGARVFTTRRVASTSTAEWKVSWPGTWAAARKIRRRPEPGSAVSLSKYGRRSKDSGHYFWSGQRKISAKAALPATAESWLEPAPPK
jgi:hypothetical protein